MSSYRMKFSLRRRRKTSWPWTTLPSTSHTSKQSAKSSNKCESNKTSQKPSNKNNSKPNVETHHLQCVVSLSNNFGNPFKTTFPKNCLCFNIKNQQLKGLSYVLRKHWISCMRYSFIILSWRVSRGIGRRIWLLIISMLCTFWRIMACWSILLIWPTL